MKYKITIEDKVHFYGSVILGYFTGALFVVFIVLLSILNSRT